MLKALETKTVGRSLHPHIRNILLRGCQVWCGNESRRHLTRAMFFISSIQIKPTF